MERQKGFYAILQFSPIPERFEFVNIGVFLAVPQKNFIEVRFSKTHKRLERLFGKQHGQYLQSLKEGFAKRLRFEFLESPNSERFERFGRNRANEIRLSQIFPIAVENPEADLDDLFDKLVGEDVIQRRERRIASQLKDELRRDSILDVGIRECQKRADRPTLR